MSIGWRGGLSLGLTALCAFVWLLTAPAPLAFAQEDAQETLAALKTAVERLQTGQRLERGRNVYFRACAPCHGVWGDGKGPAALGFDPPPRNFRRGVFKFRTTTSGVLPRDEDLLRTVREGVPGTEMVRWKNILSENDIKSVVEYIKTFSPLFSDPDSALIEDDLVEIPEERPFPPSEQSIAAGRKIFVGQDCVKCHGDGAEGDGPEAGNLTDDWERPIRPANLTRHFFRNGKGDRDIYRVFTTGLNGTPMPAFEELEEKQRWNLVDYIKSLQKTGFFTTVFGDNPNQVRHPEAKTVSGEEE